MIAGIPLSPTAIAELPVTSPINYFVCVGNDANDINSGLPVAVMQGFPVVVWALGRSCI